MEGVEETVAAQEAEVARLVWEVEELLRGEAGEVPEELTRARVDHEKLKFRINILKLAVETEAARA